MKECLECNLCNRPGTYQEATDIRLVNCHVRKFRNNKFTVWRCINCGSLHSKEVADLDLYYAHYPFRNHTLDFHTKVAYANRIRILKQLGVTEESLILDYGCGKGLYVQYLRDHGFKSVSGYDPYAPEFSNPETLSKTFDVVVSHDVIEHVEDPREFLTTMLRLSKPKGLVVIGTPNAYEINLSDSSGPAVELSQPYHRHIFSESALLRMADEYGFAPIHTYRRFYFDSLIPGVNVRFMWAYINKCEGMIDVAVEPFRWKMVLTSPYLMFLALFGYFWRSPGNILVTFRNSNAGGKLNSISNKGVVNE